MKASTQTSTVQDRRGTTQKSTRTRWLTIARGGWLGVAGICLLLLIVALPVRYAQLAAPPLEVRAGLLALGSPLSLYVFYNLILDSCVVLGFFAAAALSLKQDASFRVVTSYGVSRDRLLPVPLIYQTETIGELLLAPRSPEESFTANEHRLLKELARQAGIAVHGVLLAADLEHSRQHIVATRERARRQLGNDLHDGLGHVLAGLLRKTEMAANLLERDPATTATLLGELKQQTRLAIDETRRLAHSLHPPELELLGLVEALREQVRQYQPYDGSLRISLQLPPSLPPLPIAVESAAYYIALEALHNIQRHAGAQHAHLRLGYLESSASSVVGRVPTTVLELEITDDGCGLPGEEGKQRAGLGVTSMRERATELGGTCLVASSPTGGTRVYARLLCRQETDDQQ